MIKKLFLLFYFLLFSLTTDCSENESKSKLPDSKREKYSVSENLVYEVKSNYSHIKVTDYGSLRQLYFVRDNGEEALESTIDTNYPQNLFLLYTQTMFSSFLINEEHKTTLLIGLGGGGMVHFLNYYFPSIKMDVVEIDPSIVEIAQKYFKLKPNPLTKIYTQDAFQFIVSSKKKYDVIYMDAFLKPSQETDSTGVSKKLKTNTFLQQLKSKLNKNGLVVFNLNTHEEMKEDIKNIREEFPNVYYFQKNKSGNLIVIGSINPDKISSEKMKSKAKELDSKNKVNFSFSDITNYQKLNWE